jgi:hypothetical protein
MRVVDRGFAVTGNELMIGEPPPERPTLELSMFRSSAAATLPREAIDKLLEMIAFRG